MAFIAYYFNWSHDEILNLPHWERKRWCNQISQINEEMNREGGTAGQPAADPNLDDIPVLDLDEES